MRAVDEAVVSRFAEWELDYFVEKHEGPFTWADKLRWLDVAPLELGGHRVLLPVERDRLPNISLMRLLPSSDGASLTMFLRDTSYKQWYAEESDRFFAGHLAVCTRVPESDLFVAVVYHEWFITDNPLIGGTPQPETP